MSLPEARVSHLLAGRVRLKIPARRRDAAFFVDCARRLERLDGVKQVRTSPLTASLLIVHTTQLDAIAKWAAQQQLFSLRDDAHEASSQHGLVADRHRARPMAFDAGERAVRRARILSRSLAGLGALQTARGQFFAPALTLFWYAYDVRRGPRSPESDPVPPPKANVHKPDTSR